MLVRQLDRDVGLKNIEKIDAEKTLSDADELWKEASKDSLVKEKIKERERLKTDHIAAVLRAAAAEISELKGVAVDLEVVDSKSNRPTVPKKSK